MPCMETRTCRLLVVPTGPNTFGVSLYEDRWNGREKRSRKLYQRFMVDRDLLGYAMEEVTRLILEQSTASRS